MKQFVLLACGLAAVLANPTAVLASPTMIRLGYTDCATCHISPQGGGLLTTYGKGIDVAQSLRVTEIQPFDTTQRRLLFDVRFVAASQLTEQLRPSTSSSSSTFLALVRSAVNLDDRSRLNVAFGLESPSLTAATPAVTVGAGANLVVTKALWEYRPRAGLEIALGRDELPSGIGLPDPQSFMRSASDPGDTAYPTQIKAFVSTHRVQLTPYLFAPGGDEAPAIRQYGAGMVAGVDVWKQRAIVGVSTRTSHASAFHRESLGAFARLGFGRWGVLAEHELTSRTVNDPSTTTSSSYLAGHTELFFAAREWLVTSVAAEDIVVPLLPSVHTYRLALGAQARLSNMFTIVFSSRDVFAASTAGRTRSFSLQLAVKSIQ